MNLPIKLPFLEKKSKTEYYLAILLRDEKVTAITFKQNSGNIAIINSFDQPLDSLIEHTGIDTLVESLDKAISRAEETLPPNIETQNTVFGVKDTWVEDKTIKKDYLKKLKYVSEKLDLIPIGFIVLSEAIAHLIHQEEGAPVSALLTEVGDKTVTVSLFRAGKLIETRHQEIETTAMEAVDHALRQFERVEIFPSRVVLFHTVTQQEKERNDELAQEFIAHQWSKGLPFLHVPQVSILPLGFDGKAMVAGAATQLGYSTTGITVAHATEIQNVDQVENRHEEKHHKVSHHKEELPNQNEEDIPAAADNFGFVINKDIASEEKSKNEPPKELADETVQSETFTEEKLDHVESEQNEYQEEKRETRKKISLFALLAVFKKFHIPGIKAIPLKNRFLFVPPIILLFCIGILLLYIFTVKATVTLGIAPIQADETAKLTFTLDGENEFENNILKASTVSLSLEGSVTTDATGEKEIGNKAKGTVTMYNSGNAKKTLKEGTAITSDNGLSYVTDKEVSVASASGDIFSGIKSGTAQVSVTAKKIGTEYNLPSNTKFSIEGNNDIAAKNDAAFSGGSKKKVTVVTKKDTDKLLADLPKKLQTNAKEALEDKKPAEDMLLGDFIETKVEKSSFDKDIDEEAKSVTLKGTVKFTSFTYNASNMESFTQTLLAKKYTPNQYSFHKEPIVTITNVKKISDKELSGVAEIKTGLVPKLDTAKIAKDLAGKSFTQAQEYSKSLSQVQNMQIQLHPDLPLIPKLLPRMTNNIQVIVQPQ